MNAMRLRGLLRTGIAAGFVALFLAIVATHGAHALAVPPRPVDIPVVDQTNTLTTEQKNAISQKIASERASTGNQIGVLMIPSLQGDALEDYSLNVARTWGIGQKERNSGVLLFIAKDDRRLRIEVGYGLEGALTDIRSNQIIRDRITPQFREGKYYEGIDAGVDGIITAIHGETDPQLSSAAGETASGNIPWGFSTMFGFVALSWLGSILGRTKSWWAGGVVGGFAGIIVGALFGFVVIGIISIFVLTLLGLLFDKVVSANYQSRASRGVTPSWWAGGGSLGGGNSGGFGGFGGGGFGGGGSSGSW
jgi:uncharacterized protein